MGLIYKKFVECGINFHFLVNIKVFFAKKSWVVGVLDRQPTKGVTQGR
jgi:hypothetical protein